MSDMFLLDSNAIAASFPTTHLKSGLSELIACKITFATSDGCIRFWDACLIVARNKKKLTTGKEPHHIFKKLNRNEIT
jgi:hypothetical protein